MLKRPPTRIELKPEDKDEIEEAQKAAQLLQQGKVESAGPSRAEANKAIASRIGYKN